MTREQIEELFIAAAETDSRLPDTARPARLKAQAIPYFHTQIDVNGWGSERYQEERADFLSARSTRLRKSDVSKWELCNELVTYIPRARDRRCLWAWAASEAGTLVVPRAIGGNITLKKGSFSRWCRDVEHIHRNNGTIRKDVAISCIEAIFLRNTLVDIRNLQNRTLQECHEISDKGDILNEQREYTWSDPEYYTGEFWKASRFNPDKMRKEQRVEREKRRKEAA